MLKRYIYQAIIVLILIPVQSYSQMEMWTVGTAKTIPEHQLEISIFRPARFGISKTLEVSAQPFAFAFLPNAQIKKTWYDRKISIATVHGLNYPTIALNMLRKRNKEDYIPIDSVIPKILTFKNEVIFSKMLKEKTSCEAENYLLSLKIGFQFAAKKGESSLTHIEKPILYPRTEIYHKKILWYVGLDLDARLNHFLNYCIDVDYMSVGSDKNDWAVEHKGIIMMKLSRSLMIAAGYKLSYGTYNEQEYSKFGIYPMIDISWVYKFRKKKQMGLFGKQ